MTLLSWQLLASPCDLFHNSVLQRTNIRSTFTLNKSFVRVTPNTFSQFRPILTLFCGLFNIYRVDYEFTNINKQTNLVSVICFQMGRFFSFFRRRGLRFVAIFKKLSASAFIQKCLLMFIGYTCVSNNITATSVAKRVVKCQDFKILQASSNFVALMDSRNVLC